MPMYKCFCRASIDPAVRARARGFKALSLPERRVGAAVALPGGRGALVEFLDDDGELLLEVDDALSHNLIARHLPNALHVKVESIGFACVVEGGVRCRGFLPRGILGSRPLGLSILLVPVLRVPQRVVRVVLEADGRDR